ncbi:MAG TPA: type IVB secretion system protein IcmH/DotU [Rhodopila sp.]|nr:type IVB secretion system protein IcmH/DotU [Rhodopila sp.]
MTGQQFDIVRPLAQQAPGKSAPDATQIATQTGTQTNTPTAIRAAASNATVVATQPRGAGRAFSRRPLVEPVLPSVTADGPLMAAAAPLLQLLARLRNTLTPPDSGDLRERAAAALRRFESDAKAAGVADDMLRPTHYALCASLDDVVLNTPWGSHGDWGARSLVSTFHNEVRSGERFFEILIRARENPAKFLPVLEIMYACLSLGFMGRYRLSPRGPAEVDNLREDLYAAIASVRPRAEVELSAAWRGIEAPYRPTTRRIPFWVAGTAALAVLGGVFVWFSLDLNTASDTAYEAALRTPPVTMPTIARAAPIQPPAPVPSAEPGALDRLTRFLQPEIDAGMVQVLGTQSTPIIRLLGADSFAPGSATVLRKAVTVLQRIGAALKQEPGPVQVLGYTDNQPIRTVRFPSNFQLSAARAEAAGAVLAASIGDRSRVSTEGRADADPIAPNTTPQGRAANRRVEIILHRQG